MFGVEWLKRVLTTKPRPRTQYLAETWIRVILVVLWGVVTVVNCQKVYYALQTDPEVWVVGYVEKFRDVYRKRGSRGRAYDAVIEVSFDYMGKRYEVREKGYNFNTATYEQAKDKRWIKVYVVPGNPEKSMLSTGVTGKDWTLLVIACLLELVLIGSAGNLVYDLYRKKEPWLDWE